MYVRANGGVKRGWAVRAGFEREKVRAKHAPYRSKCREYQREDRVEQGHPKWAGAVRRHPTPCNGQVIVFMYFPRAGLGDQVVPMKIGIIQSKTFKGQRGVSLAGDHHVAILGF